MVYYKSLSLLTAIVTLLLMQNVGAVGFPDVPNAHFNAHHKLYPEVGSLGAMYTEGGTDFWIRTRYEDVEEDREGTILEDSEDGELFSTRFQFGFTTARYKGFYGRLELEAAMNWNDNSLNLDDDFRIPPLGPGPNPVAGNRIAEGAAVIPDNDFGEVNEAYIGWRSGSNSSCGASPGAGFCDGNLSFKVGRQTIIYDNHRWIGDVIWRNNNVSMNAGRIDWSPIKNLGLSYAYVKKVKRLFGENSIFNEWKFDDAHLINLTYKIPEWGKLTAYGYLMDFNDNPRTPFPEGNGIAPPFITGNVFDSDTYGLRWVGTHEIGNFNLQTEFEWANQDPSDDAGDNPAGVEVADFDDNDYTNFELGLNWGGTRVDNVGFLPVGEPSYQIRIGQETLEGNGVNALQTPLATVHAFNGWADVFVAAPGGSATPVGGLVDTSVSFQILGLFGDYIGKNKIVIAYHDYEADDDDFGPDEYGEEWNFLWGKPNMFGVNGLLGAIKFADYDADDFGVDTQKAWLLLQYRYK